MVECARILVVIIVNTALHVGVAIRLQRYNPGLFFSLVANLPVALYTTILFFMVMGPGEVAVSVVGGIIIHTTVFIYIISARSANPRGWSLNRKYSPLSVGS